MTTTVPIALFAFRRPDLLGRTLDALRANDVRVIHAFSDGARDAADVEGVSQVRQMLRAVDWADVRLVERERNLGLGHSIVSGVSAVLVEHNAVIVCEDDVVAVPGTVAWLSAALAHYRDNPKVMSVSAWTHPHVTPPELGSAPFFSGRVNTLFWGTWARSWRGMESGTASELLAEYSARGGDPSAYGVDIPAQAAVERERNIWAVRFIAQHMAHGGLSLCPPWTMVEHIGYEPRATNAVHDPLWHQPPPRGVVPVPAAWPDPVEHSGIAELWRKIAAVEHDGRRQPSMVQRLQRKLTRLHVVAPDSSRSVDSGMRPFGQRLQTRMRDALAALRLAPMAMLTFVVLAVLRLRGRRPFDEEVAGRVPLVRWYSQEFLLAHRDDIAGRVLEIGNTNIVRALGGSAVTRADSLDVVAAPGVGVVADLQRAWSIPGGSYDTFVNQFTMHVIEDDRAALYHSVRVLRPGGVLLVNFPCVSSYPHDGTEYAPGARAYVQRWYSPVGVGRLLHELGLTGHSRIRTFGSSLGMLAYVHGLSMSVLGGRWLERDDPATPILIWVRVQRPAAWAPSWRPDDAPAGAP